MGGRFAILANTPQLEGENGASFLTLLRSPSTNSGESGTRPTRPVASSRPSVLLSAETMVQWKDGSEASWTGPRIAALWRTLSCIHGGGGAPLLFDSLAHCPA